VTTFTREAQHLLRHPGMFDWSTVTLLAIVVYVYSVEVERATNRWALAIGLSLVSVGVELLLHADGVFHWYYWWWNVGSFPVIVVFGYLTFYVVAFWVHDMSERVRQIGVVSALAAIDLTAGLVFGPLLGWI
jgi:uncharacterized membrane protein